MSCLGLGLSSPTPDAPALLVRPSSRKLPRSPPTAPGAALRWDSLSKLLLGNRDAEALESGPASSSVQCLAKLLG